MPVPQKCDDTEEDNMLLKLIQDSMYENDEIPLKMFKSKSNTIVSGKKPTPTTKCNVIV